MKETIFVKSRPSFTDCSLKALLRVTLYGVAIVSMSLGVAAQTAENRYAIILDDPPVADRFEARGALRSAEAQSYQQRIETQQRTLRSELQTRNLKVTGSVSVVQNAIFIAATPEEAEALKGLPGVKGVIPVRKHQLKLNTAPQLINAPAAWTELGGVPNAGAGVKIAILDTGVDQNNPAFQDPALDMPPGYPKCSGADCAFTNNKVIAARSYVRLMAAGSGPDPASNSRPDDYSPRDRVGHGTAVAATAAANTTTAGVTFSGVAPKAWVGNYKIYGTPGVNDGSSDDAIIQALEDALMDGMDVINYSSGSSAFTGPLDTGAVCGNPVDVPCDLTASTFEKLARQGVVLIVAAGNEGTDGYRYPTFNSIGSPANAPSVLAVGATTNTHRFTPLLTISGPTVPPGIQKIALFQTDSRMPSGGIQAPLRNVTAVGNDGYACSPLPAQSMAGTIALVQRGPVSDPCFFETKMMNVVTAGAIGLVVYLNDGTTGGTFSGFSFFEEPAVVISLASGLELKEFIAANPDYPVTIDGAAVEVNATPNLSANFSSKGPATGTAILKPEVVAPGERIYLSTQAVEPLGGMYSSTGFTVTDGTSFASPMTAGAAALVKQKNPHFTAEQIKSALVNTATADIAADGRGNLVDVRSVGAGKVDAAAAINAKVTIVPSVVSFGILGATNPVPKTQELRITNTSSTPLNLALTVNETVPSPDARVTLDRQVITLTPGATGSVTVQLSGADPAPGSYSGFVSLTAAGVSARVPYLFLRGNGIPQNIIRLTGSYVEGVPGAPIGMFAVKIVDGYGVPVTGAPVNWTAVGGGRFEHASNATNQFGVAIAYPVLGPELGTYIYIADTPIVRTVFTGEARPRPVIQPGGVLNGASFDRLNPIAPGSYISIFGSNLGDRIGFPKYPTLPLSMSSVRVSFDVPEKDLSYPGRMVFVSAEQVNVQVPWELQGQTTVKMKVLFNDLLGNVVTVPLADYSPAFFETGTKNAAALDLNYRVINSSHPAVPGDVIQLFANGLGPVTNQPESGEPAPSSILAHTKAVPAVSIGGQPAEVLFSGLAPGFAGLYQVNVRVPAGLSSGQHPLVVTTGGYTSAVSGIPVQ